MNLTWKSRAKLPIDDIALCNCISFFVIRNLDGKIIGAIGTSGGADDAVSQAGANTVK